MAKQIDYTVSYILNKKNVKDVESYRVIQAETDTEAIGKLEKAVISEGYKVKIIEIYHD